LREHFGASNEAEAVYCLAMTCSILPGAVADLKLTADRMRQVAAKPPKKSRYLHGLGLILYRMADFPGAIQAMKDAIAEAAGDDPWAWIVLALAHRKLGRHDEARRWLEKSLAWLKKDDGDRSWDQVLHLRWLQREAEREVGPQAGGGPPAP
jgi:tetratricopeptide (TPR) repeat protein